MFAGFLECFRCWIAWKRSLSSASVRFLESLPPCATDTPPVSSDTTTIMASLTSLFTDCRTVSGSQILAQFHVIQTMAGNRVAATILSFRTIIAPSPKRSIMLKYIDQYLAGDQTIHLNTGTLIFCQLDQLLYYDQCSLFFRSWKNTARTIPSTVSSLNRTRSLESNGSMDVSICFSPSFSRPRRSSG